MKKYGLIAVLALYASFSQAQEYKLPALDPSPADILYYPLTVAKAKDESKPVMKVIYSRPGKKGRDIFGVLEQFGKVWRLGANEATEIRFFKNVWIGGKKVKAGTYSLFAIPEKDKWTMILNKQTDRWGAYTYNDQLDVVRVEVPVKTLEKAVETLSMTFNPQPEGANLVIAWDKTAVELPVTFK